MTHDQYCSAPECDDDCYGYEDCFHSCICAVLAKARADEREQASQRVAALNTSVGLDIDKFIHYPSAVAAARGEQS